MQRILIGKSWLLGLLAWWVIGGGISFAQEPVEDKPPPANPRVRLETSKGEMVLELFPKAAPQAVELFLQYAKDGRYNKLAFERYAGGFAIQLAALEGVEKPPLADERQNGLTHVQGAVGLAWDYVQQRSGNRLYICLAAVPRLNNKHTLIGRLSEGLEVLLQLRPGDKLEAITVSEPVLPQKDQDH